MPTDNQQDVEWKSVYEIFYPRLGDFNHFEKFVPDYLQAQLPEQVKKN